ncbi:hypothetical protein FAM23868_001971 [Propionibacterium freudenreichii]|uniref:hypothetical protein n=1 Tax=Propionibacterium freudenreichii TaxID=1744 RepID=UPI00254BDB4C|nr:hypothetical protein [Propionibacterium freudenreichii]MDK9332631.1 hypothetical protein [Propionibacterium freudenreichii]
MNITYPNGRIDDLLTDRQRTALADAIAKIERVCDTDVPTDLSDDAWWFRLSPHESRRPERGSDLDAIVIVEDWLARVSIDIYGNESVYPASWDWLNNNLEEEA